VAALFVAKGGCYFGLDDCDPWDEERDARLYIGPHPVVAHPPCQRWSKLAGFCESMGYGKKGDDGGCFSAALEMVRQLGGVLEHPASSSAWGAFGLIRPPRSGGWVMAGDGVGWTCCVDQGWYGHKVPKPTWLYASGVKLPSLRWGKHPQPPRKPGHDTRRGHLGSMWSTDRIKTPPEFRDLLLSIARSAVPLLLLALASCATLPQPIPMAQPIAADVAQRRWSR